MKIKRLSCLLVKDWQREEWSNGTKTVVTLIPPRIERDGYTYDGAKSLAMAKQMLKPANKDYPTGNP